MKNLKHVSILSVMVILMISFTECSKKSDTPTPVNPCANITCLNGGTCANGICNCPTGYTGSDCGTAKTPVSVTITKVDLISYPMTTPSGVGWDPFNGPDIFISINQGTSSSDNQTSAIAYDQTGSGVTFVTNFPITILTPSVNWSVGLWDYDTVDPDDFMGGYYFIPNDSKSGFPSTISLGNSSLSMKLYVTWNF